MLSTLPPLFIRCRYDCKKTNCILVRKCSSDEFGYIRDLRWFYIHKTERINPLETRKGKWYNHFVEMSVHFGVGTVRLNLLFSTFLYFLIIPKAPAGLSFGCFFVNNSWFLIKQLLLYFQDFGPQGVIYKR